MGTFCEYNMWKTNILSAIEKTFGRRSECEQDLFYTCVVDVGWCYYNSLFKQKRAKFYRSESEIK